MSSIKWREFISVLGGAAILAWMPLAADAQQPNKLPRLRWLPTFAATSPIYDGFRQGLRELGYVEGKNIIIETRWAEGNLDRLPELARELARLNVDVMLVGGISAAVHRRTDEDGIRRRIVARAGWGICA
jgi:putative ABC transport system substrate-binding protein